MAEIVANLPKAKGKGTRKLSIESGSYADGDTISTGLDSIESVVITASTDDHNAAATDKSDGDVTLGLVDSSGAAVTTAERVEAMATGY